MPTEIYASASAANPTSSWTVPPGVTRVFVECWGGGGGGAGGTGTGADGGGGGGAGAYAADWVNVSPTATYNFVVANSGSGGVQATNGLNASGSWFASLTRVYAMGGGGGLDDVDGSGGNGGFSGSAVGSTGRYKWSGGIGGKGRDSSAGRGGSGASSAGVGVIMRNYSGTGYNPISISGSTGLTAPVAPTTPVVTPAPTSRAGPGGVGATAVGSGQAKPTYGPGGGGGGAAETGVGADGWSGQVAMTYIRQSPQGTIIPDTTEIAG